MALKTLLLSASGLVAIMGIIPQHAQAQQTAERVTLEEVVVTARKREENLMTTPLSITAFTAKDIEASNLKDLSDISTHTPGMYFQTQVGGGSGRNDRSTAVISFRGLALSNNSGVSAGGLLFVDGAPVIGGTSAGLEAIERVEVLKGPQSAYFGRSTFAGAISYTTRDPSNEFKGRVSAEYSSYNSTTDSVSLEGPLVKDILTARISGYHYFEGGEYRNAANQSEKLGERGTNSVSGSVVLKPSDSLKFKAYLNYFVDNDGPPAQGALKGNELNCNLGGTLGRYYCGTAPDKLPKADISGNYALNSFSAPRLLGNINNNYYVLSPTFIDHAGLRREGIQSDLKADYETTDGYTFSSLTAYHRDRSANLVDLSFRDGSNIPNANAAFIPGAPAFVWWYLSVQSSLHDFSQELRVSSPAKERLRWTFGGNYLNATSDGASVNGFSVFGNLAASSVTKLSGKTPAVFGGLYFDITPELTLSGEGRYQWDKINSQAITTAGGVLIPGGGTPLVHTYTSFSPRVILDYKFIADSTLYVSWSRGYRPGGFNTGLTTIDPTAFANYFAPTGVKIAYEQEKLDNFEAGIKAKFLDDRAAVKAAVYKQNYSNGQVASTVLYFVAGNPNVQLASPIQNIGKVNLKGVELEGEFQATNQLKLTGTFALNDSKIQNYFCSDCLQIYGNSNATGHRLAISPKYNWSVTAEYTDHLTAQYDWFTRVDYTHRGSYFADYANIAKNSAADIVNLRVGVRNETFTLEAFTTNLFQNFSPQIVQGTDLFTVASTNELRYGLPQKRKYGVRGTYNF